MCRPRCASVKCSDLVPGTDERSASRPGWLTGHGPRAAGVSRAIDPRRNYALPTRRWRVCGPAEMHGRYSHPPSTVIATIISMFYCIVC
ncbi:unnamed protein product [Arctia plantaginis]|uniref:Uncharacterized protein n=1 Tax=Arctia plantaginis TaxID=874455 RepID=A0A8S0YWU3_ARCPL|nr:unnamed protein product [Arctia plantaginis]